MRILITVENVHTHVCGHMDKAVRDDIRSTLSYMLPGAEYTPRYKREQFLASKGLLGDKKPWDGSKTVALITGRDKLRLPTGLFSYLRELLVKHDVKYKVVDTRAPVVPSSGYSTPGLALRDYQTPVLDKILKNQRGIMKASTGSGKTEIIVSAFVEASCFPAVFYVTSCDLQRQAYSRFRKYVRRGGKDVEIGRVGDGHCDIQPITIATIQSCERALSDKWTKNKFDDFNIDDKTRLTAAQKRGIADMVRSAQFTYFDEVQHAACETIRTIMEASQNARFRVGGSASPWRDDGLDILVEAAFGKRLCDISASFLIRQGWLIQPRIIFNHFRNDLGLTANFNSHYRRYVSENDARNEWIAERAAWHVERGRPTIILVKWVTHAERLAKLIPGAEILAGSGESKKAPKEREYHLDRMRSGDLMCIIGTSLLDEGVDVPRARVGIFAGGGKSSTRELQRVGRFIRPDPADSSKDKAYIEEFHDHVKWLNYHARSRRKILETEPEFEIMDNRKPLGED